MRYTIPLSYNPINSKKLTEVLIRYEDVLHNQLVTDFEGEMIRFTGSPHAVALNSGTAAIHLALKVLGVGPGDYVIAPTFTYVASINPVLYLGAQPILIDSEPTTWNMDPDLLKEAIEELKAEDKRPKALLLVHTYGMPAQLDKLLEIAKKEDIPVVEDAAESLGSTYQGKMVGTFGHIGIYSFNNNKVITTYGGGILVTENQEWASKARFLASQSRENLPYYEHAEIGYNYAMGPLNAAYGLSQIPDLQININGRRWIFERYLEKFENSGLVYPTELPGMVSNRWFSTFLFRDGATKNHVTSVLAAQGIETRPLWNPMHRQPLFKGVGNYRSNVSDSQFEKGLCLPSGQVLSDEELNTIVAIIKDEI